MAILLFMGCDNNAATERQGKIDRAQAQVRRLAEDLDSRTTDTGVYIRAKDGDVRETDPWGTRLKILYSQGGAAETVVVRSAGPDREFNTNDDITAQGMTANLKGMGEGIKKNAEETATNVAKGLVKGTVSGVKESVKDALGRKKENDGATAVDDTDGKGADKNRGRE